MTARIIRRSRASRGNRGTDSVRQYPGVERLVDDDSAEALRGRCDDRVNHAADQEDGATGVAFGQLFQQRNAIQPAQLNIHHDAPDCRVLRSPKK